MWELSDNNYKQKLNKLFLRMWNHNSLLYIKLDVIICHV